MVMRALTDVLPSGNRWWWWATEVCYYSALLFSPCVSPAHLRFTTLSFGSIFESQVRSSQVLPFRRTTACLGILKEDSGNVLVTQSLCCVFIELWRIYDSNLIWCITFSSALVLHVLRYSAALEYLSLWGVGREQSMPCDAPLIPITALSLQRKYDDSNSYLTR